MLEVGQVTFSLRELGSTLATMFLRGYTLLGIASYLVSLIFWLAALSRMELSKAYPLLSIGYLAIFFLSGWLLGESLSVWRFLGTLLVTGGIILLLAS